MASKKLLRNLQYYRFEWKDIIDKELSNKSFQSVLESILEKSPTTNDRTCELKNNKRAYILSHEVKTFHDSHATNITSLCIYIGFYEQKSLTNTLPSPSLDSEAEPKTEEPPQNSNWLDGGGFLVIIGNDIFCCPCIVRFNNVFEYLRNYLFKFLNIDHSDVNFMPVANIDKLKLIIEEGVKSINLNMTSSHAELMYNQTRSYKSGLIQSVVSIVRESLADDKHTEDFIEKQHMNVNLHLSIDKNSKENSWDILKYIGSSIINDDDTDQFTIKTIGGKTIKHDDLKINKPIQFKRYGKTIEKNEAWDALIEYYKELEAHGILAR